MSVSRSKTEDDSGWNDSCSCQNLMIFFLIFASFFAGMAIYTFSYGHPILPATPPTRSPTRAPSSAPTARPSPAPTQKPTGAPTKWTKSTSNWSFLIFDDPGYLQFGQHFEVPASASLTLPSFEVYNPWENVSATCRGDWLTHYVACETFLQLLKNNTNPKSNALHLFVVSSYLTNLGEYGWGEKQKPQPIEKFLNLSKLESNQKYFVCKLLITHIWDGMKGHMHQFLDDFANRDDVIFSDLDMGDHIQLDLPRCNNISNLLRPLGVTLPSEKGFYKENIFDPHKKLTYLLSFRGVCSTTLRHSLTQIFDRSDDEGVMVQWGASCSKSAIKISEPPNYHEIMSSAKFCLLPRGDRRWTYRLMDALARGCIPVFIGDGLSLPFEQLIPWEKISIRIPQLIVHFGVANGGTFAWNMKELILNVLRQYSDDFVMKVQARISAVFMEYFVTEEKRAIAALHCALKIFQTRTTSSFRDFPMVDAFNCEPKVKATPKPSE